MATQRPDPARITPRPMAQKGGNQIAGIKDIRDGVVYLNLRKQEVAALPAVKLRT